MAGDGDRNTKTARAPQRLEDIAKILGVSESTVSRALAGSPLVAEKTRKRILEVAAANNFSINQQARNLATGRTHTIEVIFAIGDGTLQQVSDPFFVDMLAVLVDGLGQAGYDVLLSKSTPWDSERPGCAFLGGRASGLIFVGQGRHAAAIRDFARQHQKVVIWGAVDRDNDDYCTLGSDNVGGGLAATSHMLKLGRRRIVFMGDRSLPEIGRRFEGYEFALKAHGLEVDPALVIDAPFDVQGAQEAARKLPAIYPDFDGLFAASDMIALGAMASLREANISVPTDVAVVGFDDIAAATLVSPALTTIRQDITLAGQKMVERMLALLDGREAPPERLATELIVRESCGAVRR